MSIIVLTSSLDYHRHALYMRVRRSDFTLAVEEFVVAAGFGLPDDALHPPVRYLNIEALIGIRRMQRRVVFPPILLGARFFAGDRGSATQLAFNFIKTA